MFNFIRAIGASILALALKLFLSVLTVIFGALVGALAGLLLSFGPLNAPFALIGAVVALVATIWSNSK